MSAFMLIKLVTCAVSLTLGTIVMTRSAGLVVNRLVGLILLCGGQWAFCELMWSAQSDPADAVTWMRLSALGWMWIGPLVFQIFVETLGDRAGSMRRAVPLLYAAAAASILLWIATPWSVLGAEPVAWGHVPVFGALFPLTFAPTIVPTLVALFSWRRVSLLFGSTGERRRTQRLRAVGMALALPGIVSDFVLPAFGVPVPGLSSAAIATLGVLVVLHLQRYGYLILGPAAFAHEILETLQDGVALLRADGRLHSANRSLERIVGASPGGLVGRRATDLLPELRRRSGNEILSHATYLLVAGDQSVPVSVTSLALRDARGLTRGEALLVRDLREIVQLRKRLVTAGRLATVGELSTRIAQEISAPVNSVLSNLELLRIEWDRATAAVHGPALDGLEKNISEGEEMIDECIEGVERVAEVVREVQHFSRIEHGKREIASANEIAENALRLATPQAPSDVSLLRDLSATQQVSCAAQKLERVVLNLLLNSIHAVEGQGSVRLSTEDGDGCVRISVEDDGCGITNADRERIFDPFFTTKPVGEGTGLGLSISYHIVRSHGGDIRVESQPGHTRFTIELPAALHG